ncbi:MAG: hypothetical protein ABSF78_07255, partial [Candidatus Acidiferrales bacterium]
AAYFLSPLVRGETMAGTVAIVLTTAAILAGIFRDARDNGFRPVHFILPFYGSLIVLWNYPNANRFLIPLLPLLGAGLWLESKRLLEMASAATGVGKHLTEKLIAGGFSILLAAFALALLVNYFGKARSLFPEVSRKRAALLLEKREAYDWLARLPDARARVVAYEDGSLYLYTGHQASRAFTFTTAEFYDPPRLDSDLEHFTDVARAINAAYWVSSADDYGYEWPAAYAKGQARMTDLERVLAVAFRSQQNRVTIYSLDCALSKDATACRSALGLLSPAFHKLQAVEQHPR